MARYRARTIGRGGEVAVVALEAGSEEGARRIAAERGLSVLSLAREGVVRRPALARKAAFPLLVFTQQFVALLEAGLGPTEALDALIGNEQPASATVLAAVRGAVRAGQPLSQSFEQAMGAFPPLFVATVRASEKTGDMKVALARYAEYAGQVEKLRDKVTGALVYPALLAATGAAVMLFLLLYVVPRFARIYDDVGRELPWLSQALISLADALSRHAVAVFAVALACGLAAWRALSRPALRERLTRLAWRVPHVGAALRIYHLAQFYRTLAMLLESGLALVAALTLARDLLAPGMRAALDAAARRVSQGVPASLALRESGLTTPIDVSMLRVGESSGELAAMMERAAAFHEAQLARRVDVATRLFEPLLMAAIGIAIGALLVLLYLPVFELANSIQ